MSRFPLPSEFTLDFECTSADTYIVEIGSLAGIYRGDDGPLPGFGAGLPAFGAAKGSSWDFDVWLPSRQMNLQRDLCWTPLQKEQLIWSLVRGRKIPPVAICQMQKKDNEQHRILQVIDGKQRINTIYEFLTDQFPIFWKGNAFYRSELPEEYRGIFGYRPLLGHIGYDLTEDQKVQWFLQINFLGTPQDEFHCQKLIQGGV